MIEFISHEEFPDDPYCKEIVYLVVDGKYKVAYVAKFDKSGNKFWEVMSTGMMLNGKRSYHKAFEYDSNFQKGEAQKLLASKPWEKSKSIFNPPLQTYQRSDDGKYPPLQPSCQQQDLFDPGEPPF